MCSGGVHRRGGTGAVRSRAALSVEAGQSASVTVCGGTDQNVSLGKCCLLVTAFQRELGVFRALGTASHSPQERPGGLSLVLPEEGELGEKRTNIPPVRAKRGR